jgi:hypothetical protein
VCSANTERGAARASYGQRDGRSAVQTRTCGRSAPQTLPIYAAAWPPAENKASLLPCASTPRCVWLASCRPCCRAFALLHFDPAKVNLLLCPSQIALYKFRKRLRFPTCSLAWARTQSVVVERDPPFSDVYLRSPISLSTCRLACSSRIQLLQLFQISYFQLRVRLALTSLSSPYQQRSLEVGKPNN